MFQKAVAYGEGLRGRMNPLVGFGGQPTYPVGMKKLPVRIGEKDNSRTVDVTFLVVDVSMVYNVIIGRPTLSAVKAVIASYLLLMQFELDGGRVGKPFGGQRMARECYYVSLMSLGVRDELPLAESSQPNKSIKKGEPEAVMILSASAEEHGRSRPEPTTEVEEVPLDINCPERMVRIGNALSPSIKEAITSLLRQYQDVFAFEPSEMLKIAAEVMQHKLNVDPSHKLVIQKRRHLGAERSSAAVAEVKKLLGAGFIRECHYLEWVFNVVLVKKPNGAWRMCIDFTDLNRACPKDSYPLPKIDKLVDSTAGHELLSFMDAFSGYHQIPMAAEDQEKTSFLVDTGLYCYTMMPFGLKMREPHIKDW